MAPGAARSLRRALPPLLAATAATAAGYAVVTHPPLQAVPRGQAAVRTNQLSGGSSEFRSGSFVPHRRHSRRR